MSEFMHTQLLAGAVEIILNQALRKGGAKQASLTKLNEKSLAVILGEFSRPIVLTVSSNKLLVTSPTSENLAADCTIHTSIKTLVQLKTEQQLTQLIKDEQLDIDGDIKVAQHFAACFETLSIDWPSELEAHLGDIGTYKLMQLVNSIKAKLKFAKQQITSDATEWLIHEKRLAVSKQEISDFIGDVTQLEQQVSSISDTIDALAIKIQNTTRTIGT